MASRPPPTSANTLDPTGNGGDWIDVEVVYAEPRCQELTQLKLPAGATLRQAVEASGLLLKYPAIGFTRSKLGIYGKLSKADTVLRAHDRIEIYRPLRADPKEIRRQRAAGGKAMRKGRGKQQ